MTLDRWIGREARMGPGRFFGIGVTLFALKFLIDRLAATLVFDRSWSVLNYLIPVESFALLSLSPYDRLFYGTMLAVALPFVIVGIIVTLARLRDAGLSTALALLFFVPVANLLFFTALSVIPSTRRPQHEQEPTDSHDFASGRHEANDPIVLNYGLDEPTASQRALARFLPEAAGASAVVAALVPVPVSLVVTFLAVRVFRGYGWGVFVAMPFVLGMVSAILHGWRVPRSLAQCQGVACLSLFASGVAMFAFAVEGLGCLIMLAPLAIPVAMMGGALGYSIQARPARGEGMTRTLWSMLVLLPSLLGAEWLGRPAPAVFRVITSIDIDAPPGVVWKHVVTFADIPTPRDWIFRTGVAYPVRARIDGRGVGAIRHCEFSTGAFVEPIEVWDEPRLLKFAVTGNPPPMKEFSPFHIHPPHLDNFLVAHAGQFRLIDLGDGRTRVEGTTWYENGMWPETYWRWWSDHIIHRIHWRVLEHIKSLSEQSRNRAFQTVRTG